MGNRPAADPRPRSGRSSRTATTAACGGAGLSSAVPRAADCVPRLADRDLFVRCGPAGYSAHVYKEDDSPARRWCAPSDDACLCGLERRGPLAGGRAHRRRPIVYKTATSRRAAHLTTGSYDAAKLRALGVSPKSVCRCRCRADSKWSCMRTRRPAARQSPPGPRLPGAGRLERSCQSLVVRRKTP